MHPTAGDDPMQLGPLKPRKMDQPPSLALDAPNGDRETIIFTQASGAQLQECLHLYATAFGRPLSTADRMENEERDRRQPLARDNAMRTWCLALESDPAKVVCMCKTVPREFLVRDGDGARVEKGYCVATVVTDQAYRGRGLATFMLKELAAWLDGRGGAIASMLYSSVGRFYVDKGWDLLPSMQASFSVGFSSSSLKSASPPTRLLTKDDLPGLCVRDVERLRSRLSASDVRDGEILATVLPSHNVVTALHDRDEFFAEKLNFSQPITHRGSMSGDDGPWLYWYYDHRDDQMIVQRISVTPSQEARASTIRVLASMLLDVKDEAARQGLQRVTIWNPAEVVLRSLQWLADEAGAEIVVEARLNRDVPSIRWKHADKAKAIKVEPNEFYAWS